MITKFLNLLVFILVSILPLNATTLYGHVTNIHGRIGIRCFGNEITHVYKHSPAADAGLQEKDIIISTNYEKGSRDCLGPADEVVKVYIKRKGVDHILIFMITRCAFREVYD